MPTKSPERIVLDAWAVLALVFGEEPAAGAVKAIFEEEGSSRFHVHMSWVNLGEVYYMLIRKKGMDAADEVLKDIQLLPLTLHVPSKGDILAAARVKGIHRLSYADAFAVSLADKMDGTLLAGDPEITALNGTFKVRGLSRSRMGQ